MAADPDGDLLARLNALKKSHICFSHDNNPLRDHPPAARLPADDSAIYNDLAARFRKLGGKKSIIEGTDHHDIHNQIWQVAEGDTAHNEEDERTIEELLSEIGPDQQWSLQADEHNHVDGLLSEAKQVLHSQHGHREEKARKRRSNGKDGDEGHRSTGDTGADMDRQLQPGMVDWKAFRDMDEEHKEPRVSQRDEEEAEEYIAQVLAELDLETNYGVDTEEDTQNPTAGRGDIENDGTINDNAAVRTISPSPPHSSSPSQEPTLNLPDTPTTLHPLRSTTDSPLSALPSAPSFAPSRKPPITASKKSAHRKYTDEEIKSWCCICLDDATVECLGCAQEGTDEGDNLYCESCWREGHRGEGAGLEERTHRAVRMGKGVVA